MRSTAIRLLVGFAVAFLAGREVVASVPSVEECYEAADFIANAARARDNGIERDAFVDRLREDFQLIRAFPPELRWFVKDEDDEAFLQDASESVFARPRTPDRQEAEFLVSCLERRGVMLGWGST